MVAIFPLVYWCGDLLTGWLVDWLVDFGFDDVIIFFDFGLVGFHFKFLSFGRI